MGKATLIFSSVVIAVLSGVSKANSPPVADAGPDQLVIVNELVTLDGCGSYDPNEDALYYSWTAEQLTLDEPNVVNPQFYAPEGLDSIEFTLTVRDRPDPNEALSDTDTMTVFINELPIARIDATPDQVNADSSVNEGVSVTLNGSRSDDPDGTIEAYSWLQTRGPSVQDLTGDTTIEATFTVPAIPPTLPRPVIEFTLTVEDNQGFQNSSSDPESVVTIIPNGSPVSVAEVDDGLGNPVDYITVDEGITVTLRGDGSYDADDPDYDPNDTYRTDDGIESYSWVQLIGPNLQLQDANTATPTFVVPEGVGGEHGASVSFLLTVTDIYDLTDTDPVVISINPSTDVLYVDANNIEGPEWDGSSEDPFMTINDALNDSRVIAGLIEIIEVRAGTYEENVDMTTTGDDIILRSAAWNEAIGEGYILLPDNQGNINLPDDTVIPGVIIQGETSDPAISTVTVASDSKLFGFTIKSPPTGELAVMAESESNFEVAYNTIKVEEDIEGATLIGISVVDPGFTSDVDNFILVHNNLILNRISEEIEATAVGISITQYEGDTTLIEKNKIQIINNTIDIVSDDVYEAYGLYVNVNNYFDDSYLTGVLVENNIISVPRRYCVYKSSPDAGNYTEMPVIYSNLYLKVESGPGRETHNSSVVARRTFPLYDQFDTNPRYFDNKLHLQNSSPCIDAGNPDSEWSNEPWPNGDRINMGAYGNTSEASRSGTDIEDLRVLANDWLSSSSITDVAPPPSGDDIVNYRDFVIVAELWLEGTIP